MLSFEVKSLLVIVTELLTNAERRVFAHCPSTASVNTVERDGHLR